MSNSGQLWAADDDDDDGQMDAQFGVYSGAYKLTLMLPCTLKHEKSRMDFIYELKSGKFITFVLHNPNLKISFHSVQCCNVISDSGAFCREFLDTRESKGACNFGYCEYFGRHS